MRPAQAIGIAIQILEALAIARAAGRAHGEISPETVLLAQGRVELLAPAQRGPGSSERDDVFSVACLLYEMLTRITPEPGAPPPSSRTPTVIGPRLETAVMRALDPAPDARFARASEMLHELRVCLVDALGTAARAHKD